MRTKILFRRDESNVDEFNECINVASKLYQQGIDVVESRCSVIDNSLVVCRYSCLPYYDELERDLSFSNSKMINTFKQHQYVANMDYVDDISDITPKTYYEWGSLPEGQYIIKGRTNSRKQQWNRLMFASSKKELTTIAGKLLDDVMIAQQGLVVRQYVPLEQLDIGLNGLPITNEWRFFCLNGKVLCGGYYWASHPEAVNDPTSPPNSALRLATRCAQRVKQNIPFVVIDVAKTQSGDWIVIELNDGQMSGLSMIEPKVLYTSLFNELEDYVRK